MFLAPASPNTCVHLQLGRFEPSIVDSEYGPLVYDWFHQMAECLPPQV